MWDKVERNGAKVKGGRIRDRGRNSYRRSNCRDEFWGDRCWSISGVLLTFQLPTISLVVDCSWAVVRGVGLQ